MTMTKEVKSVTLPVADPDGNDLVYLEETTRGEGS